MLSSANWKFFKALGWNQIYWDFILCGTELVQENNERTYWNDRPYSLTKFLFITLLFITFFILFFHFYKKNLGLDFLDKTLPFTKNFIFQWLYDTDSFTNELPNDIFKCTFKFSSVMMRLNG